MKSVLPAGLVLFFFSSCTTASFIQHTPSLANSGLHTAKGEFTGRALYSSGSSTSNSVENSTTASPYQQVHGVQALGSYAVDDHVAVQGSIMHSAEKGGSTENGVKTIVYDYNRNVAEAGLAFFHALGKNSKFYFELSGGAGAGKYKATEVASLNVPGGRFYDHNVFKLYLQPSFYVVTDNIHMQSGLKISSVNFNDIMTSYSLTERQNRSLPTGPKMNATVLDFFFRTDIYPPGLPWLGLTTQVQLSNEPQKKYSGNMNDNNYGVGLSFRIGEMTNKKEKRRSAD